MNEKGIKVLTTKELQEKLKKIEKDFDKLTNEYEDEIERLNNIIDYTTRYIQDEKRGVKYINDILLILRGEVYLDKNNMLQDINEKR